MIKIAFLLHKKLMDISSYIFVSIGVHNLGLSDSDYILYIYVYQATHMNFLLVNIIDRNETL